MAERVILHCDCNSFYASVELLAYPQLKDRPVAVAGSQDARHGIILAKNEAAKKYNIKTAETVWKAKQKCPELVLLPPHHTKYKKYSRIINSIYESYTDLVEPFGIDESWLDITGSWHLFGSSPFEVAERLRCDVKEQTGLTISIGISFNKVFAKLGSDLKKPDATSEISKENYKQVAWPLPVNDMLYVGKKVKDTLKELGIETIGQLAGADESLLEQILGKQGPMLWRYARGEDNSTVARAGEQEAPKSIGNGLTFMRNLLGYSDVRLALGSLADEVATRLRQHNLYASAVQVSIKNPQLKTITRQKQLGYATNLAKDITESSLQLVCDNWSFENPIRMLTVTAQALTDMPLAVQTSLFEEAKGINPKREQLEQSMDTIRAKYGKTSILPAGALHNSIGIESSARPSEDENEE